MRPNILLSLLFLFPAGISLQAQTWRSPDPRPVLAHLDSLRGDQNRSEELNVIVEFTDQPVFLGLAGGLGKTSTIDQIRARMSRFATDANTLLQQLPQAGAGPLVIQREYFKTFVGASLKVPAAMMAAIQNLSYVKAVHFDREVHATSDPAITLIGADSVWARFGTKGNGIRIGIIDSGIDYLHPALGGGYGPGFKVAGGVDLVNNDGDPMDDFGHGTHVAGIAAADGDTLKGVAPEATLFAYKVLDAFGRGLESDVIAAIEMAVDPDNNGNPADRLDVVNMSLGIDNGSPTDASSIAVNNATRIGTLFCVAAGNSGGRTPTQGKENNFFYDGSATISSPGTAELALTVGASDTVDMLAHFSSRGPNRVSFSIKPDVLAPGVHINSTIPGGGFTTMNGTSMATPMVTGVAALVKSLHPDWEPERVKSALVNTAKDLGLSAFLQGGGRVQALKAASTSTLIVPSSLSFGVDDPTAGTWMKTDTLTVVNAGVSGQSYVSTTTGALPGISLTVSPSTFSISGGGSGTVLVTLSVNNAVVLNEPDDILRFSGAVSLMGSIDTARVSWAFARANRLVVTTSEPNASFLGYSDAAFIQSTDRNVSWTSPTRAEVYAPTPGTYNFLTTFRHPEGISKIVITDGFNLVPESADLFLDAGNAVFPLVYHGVDHQGVSLDQYRSPQKALLTALPNFGGVTSTFAGGSDTLLVSAASASYSFKPLEFQVDLSGAATMHVIQYDRFTGMNAGRVLTNSPDNFVQGNFTMLVPPGTTQAANISLLYTYEEVGSSFGFSGLGFAIDTMNIAGDSFAFTGYFGHSSSPSEDVAAMFLTSFSDLANLSLDYESPFIMTLHDSLVAAERPFATAAIPRFDSGADISFGSAPVHPLVVWSNNIIGTGTLVFRPLFRGMLNENRNVDIDEGSYSVFDKNGAEVLTTPLSAPRGPLQLSGERYTVVINSANSWLRHARSRVQLTSTFDLGNVANPNPPSLTSLTLLNTSGQTTSNFTHGEQATLQFSFSTIGFTNNSLPLFDSTKAWYRKHGTAAWLPLVTTKVAEILDNEGLLVRADLGNAVVEDSVAIDLRMATVDVSGHTADYEVSPAFTVGNWDTASVTGVSGPHDGGLPDRFFVNQNFPNPFNPVTTIEYSIPVGTRGRTSLRVYDLLGREVVVLMNEPQTPGTHSVRFDGSRLSSGVYFYRLQAGSRVATRKMMLLR